MCALTESDEHLIEKPEEMNCALQVASEATVEDSSAVLRRHFRLERLSMVLSQIIG